MLRAAFIRVPLALLILSACSDDTVQSSQGTTGASFTTTDAGTSTGGETTLPTTEPTTDPTPSDTTTTGETTVAPQTDTGETGTGTTEPIDPTAATETTTDPSTTDGETEGCTPGQVGCECDADMECVPEGTCWKGICEPNGGNICPYEFDGNCDEGNGICPEGSDPFDCCANQNDGVCEEISGGGTCPDGTDVFDCGGCPYLNDGWCDEPFLCPPGSDKPDCCATPENGVCEEEGMGGDCPNGSDSFDCGECQWQNDGWCDEPDLCPPGSDMDDCCAIPENGICEEEGMGGDCPNGTDSYDCGECPWQNDGECDEPGLCAEGTDGDDCCATPQDGVCEEISMGGMCPDGTDWVDCGGLCQWANDGECDEPFLCPEGTDGNDCP